MGPDPREYFSSAFPAQSPLDPAKATRAFQTKRYIFRYREIGKEGGLLVNTGNTKAVSGRGCEMIHASTHELDCSFVGFERARNQFYQGQFSIAVFSYQRMHFTGMQIEGYTLQGLHGIKGLSKVGQGYQGLGHAPAVYSRRARVQSLVCASRE